MFSFEEQHDVEEFLRKAKLLFRTCLLLPVDSADCALLKQKIELVEHYVHCRFIFYIGRSLETDKIPVKP